MNSRKVQLTVEPCDICEDPDGSDYPRRLLNGTEKYLCDDCFSYLLPEEYKEEQEAFAEFEAEDQEESQRADEEERNWRA